MEKSKVYYSDMRVTGNSNLLIKLEKLIKAAGIGNINFEEKFAAIKVHFGEPGNLSFLKPNYAKVVADIVKEFGGKPFLTDCNTLYVGGRKNALDHIDAAYENGYTPFSTGCHVIIADGLKGLDEVYVPVLGGELVKEAKIGRAIMDANIFISLNHFKGHELTGFGGCLKNIGMGCGSRAGKMEQHNDGKPIVSENICVNCKACAKNCAHGAISFETGKAFINENKCVGCGRCLATCNFDAIYTTNSSANIELNKKIAEYSKAVLHNRPHFHISLVIDVSPYCDCHGENDTPIIPDVGMFASFDPVALDQACADMSNKMPAMPNSHLGNNMQLENFKDMHDHFTNSMPTTDWQTCLEHAEKIGIGTREYELIEV